MSIIKPPSTVRLFNRNDYYTCHGEDANIAAGFTSAAIKIMGEQPKLSYVCLNKTQFELFLRELLLVRQYRVEVYVKTSQKNNDWYLEYKGSPGNLSQFEELLFENSNIEFSNSIMGLRLVQNKILAISCINITEAKFEVCEISDNECFSELEALIAQIGPKECVLPAGDSPELTSLKNVLERNGILIARVKRSDFSGEDIIQDLNRLLYFREDQQRNASTVTETNMKEAMGCLQAVIKFLNLTGDEKNFNQFKLNSLDPHRFVRLDNAALYALNVLPKPGSQTIESSVVNPNAAKTNSLKGILDSCVTVQGRRLLEQWIKQPLKDYNLINDRLDAVEALVKDAGIRMSLIKDCLPRLTDLMSLSRKISCKKGKLQDCYRVYQTISSIPIMLQILKDTENKCIKAMLIDPISDIIMDLQNFQNMIEQTLDLELVDRGEFLVKCSFDDDLNELHVKKEKIGEKMQRILRYAAEDLGFEEGKTIKLECNDQHGYFFRVTLKEEHALRKSKNYKIIGAIKGGVRFTNDKLAELNKDYQTINEEYMERQKTVVAEIFEVAAGYADSLRNLNVLLATLDVLVSFATAAVSARIPYTRPKLLKENSGVLNLKKVRHPCLEAQDHVSFIPNNAAFDQNEKILHIITGPNMCGKSTYIRSIGTCVLMAHIGSLVPCEEAIISLVDGILVRVGADDCQLKGLSTFMLEMIETSTIIKSATKNSLVIIDELGRGTSTYDGCGIAWAIAEHLATEIKCFSLFATHYHEISRLAELNSCVSNLHVTAVTTSNTITPLYQIREGECDKSYGIHCARMVGFPEDVIKDAIEYQKELEHYSGMKFVTNFEQSLKRKVMGEGDAIIKNTLKKLKSMDINNLSDSDLCEVLDGMKNELGSTENLFIKGLLSD
ncbi:DNA mismatch repair protein Msh2 [Anoplophora glabripennis]|uniref:DNA mismatch repair protein Msh2 n=1 Tax=Anoplophora glabripennis TaxID=217634 RepID=UPI0008745AAC|nr:DNA mismatch repair protein Msh2 [Anoplophora glabripennis]